MRRFPALVAAVTGDDGDGNGAALLGVQRTWLDPRSPAKAVVRRVGCAPIGAISY